MDFGIKGKKALVCGASSGIGLGIAMTLAQEGVDLLLCARSDDKLQAAAKDIVAANGDVSVRSKACDLTSAKSRDELIEFTQKEVGNLDILIHNVGGPKPTFAAETSVESFETGFSHLFSSVAHLNLAFLPAMKERKWGRIITVTSLSVLEPIAGLAISNAIRSAVTSMLKTLADEVAASNITVNCVAPGAIDTERLTNLMEARLARSGQSREEYMNNYLNEIPARRMGTPEEFGAVVAFLCSQQASYVTGSTICIDGGKRRSTY